MFCLLVPLLFGGGVQGFIEDFKNITWLDTDIGRIGIPLMSSHLILPPIHELIWSSVYLLAS